MSVDAPVSSSSTHATQEEKRESSNPANVSPTGSFNKFLGRRVTVLRDAICAVLPRGSRLTGIDVGCGNGTLTRAIIEKRPDMRITGVDVQLSPKCAVPAIKYDGVRLPFEDKSVDFVILSDVLHFTDSPRTVLMEATRVARKFIIIKDAVCDNNIDRATLRLCDLFGKSAPSAAQHYKYFSSSEWETVFAELGLKPEVTNNKLGLYPVPFNFLFERKLHFVSRLAVEKLPGGVERWLTMSKMSQRLRLTSPMR